MRFSFFRLISIIVLISVVIMLSGLSEPAFASLVEKAEKPCCDECNKRREPEFC